VFEDFEPKLSPASSGADVVFLGNIQPELQRDVREQCDRARFVAMDSMNLWIEIAHEALLQTISLVDCLVLNDSELKQLTDEPNLVAAARKALALGPRVVIAKQGEYGSAMITAEGYFGLTAYPTTRIVEPTGAGDTFAGGLMGYLAASGGDADDATLRRAMAYGTACASFNVEGFGSERLYELDRAEIDARVAELEAISRF
jgi:sugar/nucleoside kinase (ribokinase family)